MGTSWNNWNLKLIADLLQLWRASELSRAEIILTFSLQKKKKKKQNKKKKTKEAELAQTKTEH